MPVEELLIVGTLGGGGIHRYVEAQKRHLEPHLDVSVHDMYSEAGGSGPAWLVRSLVFGLLAALRFPLRSRPDVVHVHTSHEYSFLRAAPYVLFAAFVWRRPVVVHVHGSSFDEFVRTESAALAWLQRTVFDAADAVVVLSEYWRTALADVAPEDRVRVVPNAIVPEEYEAGAGADPPHVVFLSNLFERKGVPAFVDAVDELLSSPAPPVRVSVAGDGTLADEVVDLAERHDAVTYHGYVSETEKHELLSSGSVYVLPTHAEGLPIAMLEGMAGANAVVSTAVGSIPEVIGPENGRLVTPGDADELAAVLADLVDDPETVAAMGRRNRALVAEEYAWETVTETLLALYEAVARGEAAAGRDGAPAEVGEEAGADGATGAGAAAGSGPGGR